MKQAAEIIKDSMQQALLLQVMMQFKKQTEI